MKKIICTLLALVMLFALCACGENSEIYNQIEETSPIMEAEFSLGETDGDIYKNEFIGLGYKKASDWVYYTDEQIMELNNVAMDMASEEAQEIIENATILYAMYTSDTMQLNNININLEKLGADEVENLDIVNNYDQIVPVLEDAFEQMGCTGFEYQHKKISIDGESFDAIKTKVNISGADMHQLIFQKKCGEYLANITVTTCFEDTTDNLIGNFFLV